MASTPSKGVGALREESDETPSTIDYRVATSLQPGLTDENKQVPQQSDDLPHKIQVPINNATKPFLSVGAEVVGRLLRPISPRSGSSSPRMVEWSKPKSSTPQWRRVLLTLYFLVVCFTMAIFSCILQVMLLLPLEIWRLACLSESSEAGWRRKIWTEWLRGFPVDLACLTINRVLRPILPIHVLGEAGQPNKVMSQTDWEQWLSAERAKGNTRKVGAIEWVKLPRNSRSTIILPAKPVLFSNHMSNLDGLLLKGVLAGSVSKFIIKSEVANVPFVGWTVWLAREPFVYFTKEKGGWGTRDVGRLMTRCKEILDHNLPLVVYPEGARRNPYIGRMQPLRHGMINFAINNAYPLVPSVVHGTQRGWPVGDPFVDFADVYMRFSSEVIVPKVDNTAEEIVTALRTKFLELLDGIPGYDAEKERPIETVEEFQRLESTVPATGRRKKIQ